MEQDLSFYFFLHETNITFNRIVSLILTKKNRKKKEFVIHLIENDYQE